MKALEFKGDGAEYFKIWIVNILLTVVTLGIYYPWAKVRSRRYFMGSTFLEDANFEYHATGKQLFIGFLISMAFFIAYVLLSEVNPMLAIGLMVILIVAMPWIIWRSLKFNHRMVSYRNVRFGFKGSLGGAYTTFFGYPLAVLIGFGLVAALIWFAIGESMIVISTALMALLGVIFYPIFFAVFNKVSSHYFVNGSYFGQGKFTADLTFKRFLMIMLKAMGITLLWALIALSILGVLAYLIGDFDWISSLSESNVAGKRGKMGDYDIEGETGSEMSDEMGMLIVGGIMLIYPFFIALGIYVSSYLKAKHRDYLFSQTTLDESIKLRSTLAAKPLFQIRITNLLLVMMSAGIAYPWTKIRLHKYLTETIEVEAENGFGGYVSQQTDEGALGEELGEAFDIDIGGVAF